MEDKIRLMNFGDKLKKYREDNNLSQRDLAEKLGVEQQSVFYLEKRDYVKPITQKNIEKKLGVSLDGLSPNTVKAINNLQTADYYRKQAAIFKEQYEHCLRMAELVS